MSLLKYWLTVDIVRHKRINTCGSSLDSIVQKYIYVDIYSLFFYHSKNALRSPYHHSRIFHIFFLKKFTFILIFYMTAIIHSVLPKSKTAPFFTFNSFYMPPKIASALRHLKTYI